MRHSAKRAPVIVWFREDLRLADNPALSAAAASGAPVIPLFILDETGAERRLGAASRWWLDKSLAALAETLGALGARLVLRRGPAGEVVEQLLAETGAAAVYWNRGYEPKAVVRDVRIEARLALRGVAAHAFDGALLTPPGSIRTGAGGPFKVFTAFWRAAQSRLGAVQALPQPDQTAAHQVSPTSDTLADWGLHPACPDWSGGFSIWTPGETGAAEALDRFLDGRLRGYAERRDLPGVAGCSRLSAHLRWGEISPREVWRATQAAVATGAALERDADKFLSELGWREFNWQLLHALPDLATRNVQPAFDRFAWRLDPQGLRAWTRGLTGYPMVDAGMRELWATGFMHNRVRMIAASFLTKHLMIDWREGETWFWDTLVDADAANNAANWQWVAGSGADAAPYFRIFNPTLQGKRFDPDGAYVRRWVPELAALPAELIHEPWRAGALATGGYPQPIVRHDEARARALAAYADLKEAA